MSRDQPRPFEPPEPEDPASQLSIHIDVTLPGPGYDHLITELVNDALARMCHDSGLFPNQIAIKIDLDYIDSSWFRGDSLTSLDDNDDTNPVNACTRHPQPE
jgi:hypothetical protein